MGGIGRYAQSLAVQLSRLISKDELVLFTTQKQVDPISHHGNVVQVAFEAGMVDAFWEQLHLPGQIKEHAIDLYHNTCFALPIASEGCRLVTTIHDVVFRERPDLVAPRLREYLDRWTEVALKIAHRVITVSHSTWEPSNRRKTSRGFWMPAGSSRNESLALCSRWQEEAAEKSTTFKAQ
jgi:hypothetical protein